MARLDPPVALPECVREMQQQPRVALHRPAHVAHQYDRPRPHPPRETWQHDEIAAGTQAAAAGAAHVDPRPATRDPAAGAAHAGIPRQAVERDAGDGHLFAGERREIVIKMCLIVIAVTVDNGKPIDFSFLVLNFLYHTLKPVYPLEIFRGKPCMLFYEMDDMLLGISRFGDQPIYRFFDVLIYKSHKRVFKALINRIL